MDRPAEGQEWRAHITSDEAMKLLYLPDLISQVLPSNISERSTLHARPVIQAATSSNLCTSTMAVTHMTLVRPWGQTRTRQHCTCFVCTAKQLLVVWHATGQRATYSATMKHSSSPCCATSSASIWLCRQPKRLRTLHPVPCLE